jgi:hypothetical protein
MNHRRLVGIDLGIATAHTVRVLDGEGTIVAKRKAWPAKESLAAVETAALAGCPDGTPLEVVIEPTGPAWLPVAVFFFRPRPPGVPGLLAEGRRPAPVLVPARQVQRHRRRHPGAPGKRRMSRSGTAGRGDHTAATAGQGAYLTAGRGDRWRQAPAAAFAMPHPAIPAPAARTGRMSFAIGLAASEVPCCPVPRPHASGAKRPLAEQGQVVWSCTT